MKNVDLFDAGKTIAADLLKAYETPWEVLPHIKEFILALGPTLDPQEYDNPAEGVWIAKDANVFPSAYLGAPCIVDHGAEVRHCAFIRESAIVGKGAVVGNSTELKNVLLCDGVQVPHYNYVGDSILGHKAHMGAGAITSNVKGDRSHVVIKYAGPAIDTGMKKVGAMLGDFAEIGCNSVLCPGSIVGRNASVYPLCLVRGVVPEGSILKANGSIIPRK